MGAIIYKWRWGIVGLWLGGAGLLVGLVLPCDRSRNERRTFLPPQTPHQQAARAFSESFPGNSGLSEAVIVFERGDGPLTNQDKAVIEGIAAKLTSATSEQQREDMEGITVRSPRSIPLPHNPMVSPVSSSGQGALIKVSIPANFITMRSARIVDHIRRILKDTPLPQGLEVAVTGSSGFGRDYALAAEKSHRRTLVVTLIAVVIILLIVYRAPLVGLIPLGAISLGAVVAMRLLTLTEHLGMHIGTAEKIFVIVLLYGAGVDYSLLLISRYRENLDSDTPVEIALPRAVGSTFWAILTAAGTDIAGLLMLCFADYRIFRTTGPAVAIALGVGLLSAITLVPALIGVAGKHLFWGGRRWGLVGARKVWPMLAQIVARKPTWVLVVTLVVLGIPAFQGLRLTWVYDTLAALSDDYGAARGMKMARRHWCVGEIAPVRILLRNSEPVDAVTWEKRSEQITHALKEIPGVRNVRSLSTPLGTQIPGAVGLLAELLARDKIMREYVSGDYRAARMEVILDYPPLTLKAMDALGRIRSVITRTLVQSTPEGELFIAGATAEMSDTRRVTRRDFYRVATLALGVIFLIVVVLLRDAILTAFMVASTVLSYLGTLGITYWVFAGLLGQVGLDWKVQVFLFVVMVAVGVDYNIFLTARMSQEARTNATTEAIRRAVVQTGPVISSCGLIMAATLGSLLAGDLQLLKQLGFALGLGMLIDTFIVRPLLLPAFATLTNRTGRAPMLGH